MANEILDEGKVNRVLRMLELGFPQKAIAREMGVGKSTISDIACGKTWAHINRRNDTARILAFGDLHAPYNHPDAFDFLADVKRAIKPTTVISLGDDLDSHALSFYPTELNLDNATKELEAGRKSISILSSIFPKVVCVDSNHTSRAYRAGKRAGIPKELILPYEDILGVRDKNWKFVRDYVVTLPNGEDVFFVHNGGSNCFLTSQRMGMSVVAGHVHSKSFIQHWSTVKRNHFALQTGCLIDGNSSAFLYNVGQILRPQLGCSAIINSKPVIIAMNLDKDGRWDGEVQV